MADDSYFSMIINALRGTPSSANTSSIAPPLTSYPSDADAENARKYGFSQGNEQQGFLDNEKARILGGATPMPYTRTPLPQPDPRTSSFTPISGAGMYPTETMNPAFSQVINPAQAGAADKTNNLMMRAALAANRSPIAALGFDPSHVVMDTQMKQGAIGGAYAKGPDDIYTGLSPDDSILHESTHRGLQKLREAYPDQAPEIMKSMPNEEMVVRWLMHSKGGDPEGGAGEEDAKQRQEGIDLFNEPDKWASQAQNVSNLNKLQELAIGAMKDRGKRVGPQ